MTRDSTREVGKLANGSGVYSSSSFIIIFIISSFSLFGLHKLTFHLRKLICLLPSIPGRDCVFRGQPCPVLRLTLFLCLTLRFLDVSFCFFYFSIFKLPKGESFDSVLFCPVYYFLLK